MTLHDAATPLRDAAACRLNAAYHMGEASAALNDQIIAAHKAGMTPTQIAATASVSRQHVHNVLKGQQR